MEKTCLPIRDEIGADVYLDSWFCIVIEVACFLLKTSKASVLSG